MIKKFLKVVGGKKDALLKEEQKQDLKLYKPEDNGANSSKSWKKNKSCHLRVLFLVKISLRNKDFFQTNEDEGIYYQQIDPELQFFCLFLKKLILRQNNRQICFFKLTNVTD